jgi:subtilisin-like proprotein convertase family protein
MSRIFLVLFLFSGFIANAQQSFFVQSDFVPTEIPINQSDRPNKETFLDLNVDGLEGFLSSVNTKATDANHIISLPDGNGRLIEYKIAEASVLEDDFQANFPNIRSFKGQGISNPQETIRFSVTPLGLHIIILGTSKGTQIIRPFDVSRNLYTSYHLKDLNTHDHSFECQLIEDVAMENNAESLDLQTFNANDGILRNFRIAVSATAEYSAFFNSDINNVISAITIAVNNANAVLERDLSVTLTLMDNTGLIFFDPATDPFTNFDNVALLDENQALVDTVIGDANYDIGHVFNTAGGGVAGLNTSCVSGFKAWGVTGATSATDPRFLFVFLHELGHQFGSPHTFNGSEGGCGPNISPSTALEPGSGTTLMAYPGLCGIQNVINNAAGDLYYHQISLATMWNHILNSGICPIDQTVTGNSAPTADAGADYLIPQGTPYKLVGNSTDTEGTGSHTYTWEQYDFGPAGAPTDTTEFGPLVRSFEGTTNPVRYVPNLNDLAANPGSQTWERLVTVDRNINFRLTVRDNDANGGQTAVDAMLANVTTLAGPFEVTSQSTPNQIIWTPGTTETITWNVAGTDANGIDEAFVNILLSTDEGLTFDTVLASNTPNDGVEDIIVPNIDATKCRIMIEAVNNIFFNINEAYFAIGNYSYGEVCEDYTFNPNTFIIENASSYNAIPFQITDSVEIQDLNFNVNISGAENNGFLTYGFSPPSGGFYVLGVYPCPGTNGINLTFDDEGNPIDCSDLSSGANVLPSDPLSVVDGENAQGNWTFWITDVNEDGVTSDINSFTLNICSIGLVPNLSVEENTIKEVSIYPNPNYGTINLSLNSSSTEDLNIEVFDLSGRRLKTISYAAQHIFNKSINVTDLASGIYIVKVNQGNNSISKKLIIK